MLILMPSVESRLHAFNPSRVVGSFTTTFLCQLANSAASSSMPRVSVATTSTLTGPSTIPQISRIVSLNGLPSLATSDGFVVTPSRMPSSEASRISLIFAVSRKNFMLTSKCSRRLRILNSASFRAERGICLRCQHMLGLAALAQHDAVIMRAAAQFPSFSIIPDWIAQRSHACHAHIHHVAGFQWSHAFGRAGGDQVAG